MGAWHVGSVCLLSVLMIFPSVCARASPDPQSRRFFGLRLSVSSEKERLNNQNGAATSADSQHHDRCPPPSPKFLEDACGVGTCTTHKECPGRYRCCYNGCVYTCLEPVSPPPVVDWLIQPKPRWLGGYGWLLDGPEEVLQAETCTTTEDGETPLACPTGYECFITGAGDASNGIPNHGRCVHHRHLTYRFRRNLFRM
uniref:WAP four-disulfide core domain protein 1 isoform X1 n=1 Tax=Myxine glutinosa TaxID=7769 RepID=UPI00358FBC02